MCHITVRFCDYDQQTSSRRPVHVIPYHLHAQSHQFLTNLHFLSRHILTARALPAYVMRYQLNVTNLDIIRLAFAPCAFQTKVPSLRHTVRDNRHGALVSLTRTNSVSPSQSRDCNNQHAPPASLGTCPRLLELTALFILTQRSFSPDLRLRRLLRPKTGLTDVHYDVKLDYALDTNHYEVKLDVPDYTRHTWSPYRNNPYKRFFTRTTSTWVCSPRACLYCLR